MGFLASVWAALPAVPIDITAEEAQRRADAELSKAKYTGIPQWFTDFLDVIGDAMERLVEMVLGGAGAGGGVSWGGALVLLVVVGIVGVIVWRVGLPRWRRRTIDDSADIGIEQSVSPSAYRDLAEAAAANGDYRTAVRERFRAIVRELEYRTIIAARPSRTALEAAHVVGRALPAAGPPMRDAAELFSAVMYGDAPATVDDWNRILAAETSVNQHADTPLEVVA
jgi:hypothetical protein